MAYTYGRAGRYQANKNPHHGPSVALTYRSQRPCGPIRRGVRLRAPCCGTGARKGADQAIVADCGTEVVVVCRSLATKPE